MSRISRYQESLSKFIKNKNIDTYFSIYFKEKIYQKLIDSDHLGGIIVSTLFNHNSKKTNQCLKSSVATVRPDTFLENTTHRSGGPPLPTTDKGALYAAV
jgi:hypothetical protein